MKILRLALTTASIAWFAASSFAAPAAAPAPSPLDFPKGPAQWLLTRDEKAAWKGVTSAEEAQRLIDLFWARRDPTPGTTRNEFHEEFDNRVSASDEGFSTERVRGSLTDKGRVLILLGPPIGYTREVARMHETNVATTEGTGGGAHELAGKQIFSYRDGRLLGLTGDVYFFEDLRTHEFHFDPQRGNVAGALASAVSRALINPGLKEVPDWASSRAIAASHQKIVVQNVPASAAVPVRAAQPAGVSPLLLLKDVNKLNPRGAKDPLAAASSIDAFSKQDDLGYAASLCVANYDPANPPTLKVAMTITGEAGGQKVRMTAPEDDYSPDAIQSLPGCYLTRGALPLAEFGAGAYKLSLTLTDTTSPSAQKYNLEQSFKVE
jgi:GWxTD domain-containing protein